MTSMSSRRADTLESTVVPTQKTKRGTLFFIALNILFWPMLMLWFMFHHANSDQLNQHAKQFAEEYGVYLDRHGSEPPNWQAVMDSAVVARKTYLERLTLLNSPVLKGKRLSLHRTFWPVELNRSFDLDCSKGDQGTECRASIAE